MVFGSVLYMRVGFSTLVFGRFISNAGLRRSVVISNADSDSATFPRRLFCITIPILVTR